jgi:hypothetical protein
MLDVMHHRLDHHDRIVDDDADGEDETEQREDVDRKPRSGKNMNAPTSDTGTVISGSAWRASSAERRRPR